ncbi:hypothetical protein [Capnocytophaga canimorsus]|uniref:Uncharacterized protein n=1 Tax=Capnocytophaga canimorsus TaxID=28188 RepID=A0A0B7INA1_9FLAO|nr:hypothetical protein [Capnocytophaga canimorsus]AWL78388.1 hypothetical protein DKB58_05230 [Capnocytophaga canimorsus]AYW37012.1 hypothetical protein D8L92_06690 [Capnocytophaga canimorsus]MDT9499732.1 hypothetical protein [Capnocytophaga canimorsus]CEN51463.1 conserved hypothetical protein [Capnocytophaga canimorsus]
MERNIQNERKLLFFNPLLYALARLFPNLERKLTQRWFLVFLTITGSIVFVYALIKIISKGQV